MFVIVLHFVEWGLKIFSLPSVFNISNRLGSAHAQDLKRLLFDSSVPQTIFLPDPGSGSFPVAV